MKKLVLIIVTLAVLFNSLCAIAYATPTNEAYIVTNFAKKWAASGEGYAVDRCVGFVNQCIKRSIGRSCSRDCAYCAWLTDGVSTSNKNIPLGAAVYFKDNRTNVDKCSKTGIAFGHIALYVGDGYVVHTYGGKICKETLKSVMNWKNYTYLGWGWHGGYVMETNDNSSSGGNNAISGNATNNSQTTSSVKISPNSYPSGNLKYGSDFTLTAKFTSDCAIVEARAYMLDSNKNVIMEAKGSSTTSNYYVEGYALDKGMKFNELSPGGYYLKYYVKDANGDTKTWTSEKFYVVKSQQVVDMSTTDNNTQAPQKDPESSLNISLNGFPSSIENGTTVRLKGTITSNYKITEVEAVLFNRSQGFGYYPTRIYPNSKFIQIENTELSDGIYFEGMPGGIYELEITAKDEKTSKKFTKSINISERKIEEDDLYSDDVEINNNQNTQKCGNNAYWDFDLGVLTISGSGRMYDYSSPWELPWYDIQSEISEIVIEEGITYIGSNAFCWSRAHDENAMNIDEIHIPSTVEGLGDCVFAYVDEVDTVYYNARDCEFDGTTLGFAYNYFARGKKLVIGEDVERIGANVFYRGRFDEVVCVGDWANISVDMTGNEVLEGIETQNREDDIVVKVDGRRISFDQPPIIEDGRTLVPMRAIFESLGAEVDWNGREQAVGAQIGDTYVNLFIGEKVMYVSNFATSHWKEILLDVPAKIVNDRTLVPVRAIAESFGCDVDWNGTTRTVIINTR